MRRGDWTCIALGCMAAAYIAAGVGEWLSALTLGIAAVLAAVPSVVDDQ